MTTTQKTARPMNVILWIVQGILALTFIWAGSMKLFQPEQLPFPWIEGNATLVTVTGIIDLIGGIGIILPALLRVHSYLTVYAAYGIVALMLAAIVFHIARGEANAVGFNIFIVLLAAFVSWGRRK